MTPRKPEATKAVEWWKELGNQQSPAGWLNLCPTCLAPYWVRNADQGRPKVRRFVSPDSDKLHQCQEGTV